MDSNKLEIAGVNELVDKLNAKEERIVELEKENADLKNQNENLIEMLKAERSIRHQVNCLESILVYEAKIEQLENQIEKMKCCENCKHHYWLYEELACRIHKIDVDTCNSWEMKND